LACLARQLAREAIQDSCEAPIPCGPTFD